MDRIVVRMKESDYLYEEKLDIIKGGICPSIFQFSIMRSDSVIMGYYKTSGYRKLGDYSELTAKSIFIALEKVFQAIEECIQFLIFPEEFALNINTIYIDERFTHVKFLYIPDDRCKYKKRMEILLAELSSITTEEGNVYLDMLSKIIKEEKQLGVKHHRAENP